MVTVTSTPLSGHANAREVTYVNSDSRIRPRVYPYWVCSHATEPSRNKSCSLLWPGDLLCTVEGGLALSRPLASAAIAAFIIVCLFVLPQRAGRHPGTSDAALRSNAK
jgi:hypothetical protein